MTQTPRFDRGWDPDAPGAVWEPPPPPPTRDRAGLQALLLTADQVAEELAITPLEVAALIDSGLLPHVTLAGEIRVPLNALEKYRERCAAKRRQP